MSKHTKSKDSYSLMAPVDNMLGAVQKGGVIFRQKRYSFTTADGHTHTILGKKEVYKRSNPRDFRLNPATGAELEHQTLFGKACKQAAAELKNPDRYAYWEQRFVAQLNQPEPNLPKSYVQFRVFVRTAIYYALRDESAQN